MHQALKLIRPSTLPKNSSGVIAANTNWKYARLEVGKCSAGMTLLRSGMLA